MDVLFAVPADMKNVLVDRMRIVFGVDYAILNGDTVKYVLDLLDREGFKILSTQERDPVTLHRYYEISKDGELSIYSCQLLQRILSHSKITEGYEDYYLIGKKLADDLGVGAEDDPKPLRRMIV